MTLQNFDVPLGTVKPSTGARGQGKPTEGPRKGSEIDPRAEELLKYFLARFTEAHGYAYRSNWPKDLRLVNQFLRQYRGDAKPMIDYLFDALGGRFGPRNEIQTPSLFSKGSSWLVVNLRDLWRRRKDEPAPGMEAAEVFAAFSRR